MQNATSIRPAGVRRPWPLLAFLLFSLLASPALGRDGQVLVGSTPVPQDYRYKKNVRYLPVAPVLKALGIPHEDRKSEATLTLNTPWRGTVHVLFSRQEAQFGGQVHKLRPEPLERAGTWYLTIPQMEQLFGVTATLTTKGDLSVGVLGRVESSATGQELVLAAPVTPRGFALDNPPRYAIDLPLVVLDQKHPNPYPCDLEGVKAIRLGQFEPVPPVARLVYDLSDTRFRPVYLGQGPVSRIPLGKSVPKPLMPSSKVRIGLAPDGSGLVVDGLHAGGATLIPDSPHSLRIVFTGAQLTAAANEYQHKPGMTDSGVRHIALANAGIDKVEMVIDLGSPAPGAFLRFDPVTSQTILTLKPAAAAGMTRPHGAGLQGKVIVIDPGHGGPWPGAVMEPGMVGPVRLLEKDLNLRMSLDLAQRLRALGATVILAREADVSLKPTLREDLMARLELATTHKADLLVSIHCNSFKKIPSTTLSGTEIYYHKATDAPLADLLFRHMAHRTGRGGRGALHSRLMMTMHSTVPSVLVECGYMSNPDEYALFADPTHEYEKTLMTGLTEGIVAWATGQTQLPATALDTPFPERPAWLDQLIEHALVDGPANLTEEPRTLQPIPATAPGGAAQLPALLPEQPAPPSLGMPVRTTLPDRSSRPDPEINFSDAPLVLQPLPPPAPVEKGGAWVPPSRAGLFRAPAPPLEEEAPAIPGATPHERRMRLFSLGD